MYERLMRIMMVSVINKTNTKVKFWILGNYASPAFRKSLPILAKKYGFEFEFVQYKWPRWLNQQTEKQRTMWGYKILFLDVLFPLEVDKIIFVDADQIVRADLKELVELDLEGNPYGYTPFCDDRKEMDGFRFWNGGYWKQHLAGRRYHISGRFSNWRFEIAILLARTSDHLGRKLASTNLKTFLSHLCCRFEAI